MEVAADPPPFSQRDRDLLEALAEQRVAVVAQVARWLGVTETTAGRRVAALHDAGLLERSRQFTGESPALRITEAGLKRIGSALGKPGRKLDEHRHDVGVGWVWTAAREGAFGELSEIVSERSMRSHDARLDRMPRGERFLQDNPATYGVGIGSLSTTGRLERHYPDLLLRTGGGQTIAMELELTSKGRRRLDKVMAAYAADPRIDAVLYLVPDAAAATKIREAAARAGIGPAVYVRQLTAGGIGGIDTRVSGRGATASRAVVAGRGKAGAQLNPVAGRGTAGAQLNPARGVSPATRDRGAER